MLNIPRVLNGRTQDARGAVFIGRPSKWGNPFVIGKDGDRRTVILKFEKYLLERPELMEEARRELKGKDLVCYCSPSPCHGDVLLRIANV